MIYVWCLIPMKRRKPKLECLTFPPSFHSPKTTSFPVGMVWRAFARNNVAEGWWPSQGYTGRDVAGVEGQPGCTWTWGPHLADDRPLTQHPRPDVLPGPRGNWKQGTFCPPVLVLGSVWSWSIMLHGNLLKCFQPHHYSKGFVSLSINPSSEEFIAQLVFITLRWKLPYKISAQKHFFSLANTKYQLKNFLSPNLECR